MEHWPRSQPRGLRQESSVKEGMVTKGALGVQVAMASLATCVHDGEGSYGNVPMVNATQSRAMARPRQLTGRMAF